MDERASSSGGLEMVSAEGLRCPVAAQNDIVFGRAGGKDLLLDLFRPTAAQDRLLPAVIFIHGGGWGGGNKESYHDLAARVASHGYVCACVSYRLSGEAPFPAAVEDCKCAVRWLRAHAPAYRADPGRFAAWGHSAGGHLAAMVALTPGQFEGEGGWSEQSSAVQVALCFSTPFDLTDAKSGLEGIIRQFVGPAAEDAEKVRAQASPINYVAGKKTPFILFHGVEDVLPIGQSDRFAAALREAGVPFELVRVPQAGHDLERYSPDIFVNAVRFLDQRLRQGQA
jgi:acetyl esterase/lipase